MKLIVFPALAGLSLAISPVAASAQQDSSVSYDDAMKCSALFSLIASGSEGNDVAEFEEMATRWLVVAMERDGTEDGSKAGNEAEQTLGEMIEALEEFSEQEEAAGEEFLVAGIDFCEAKHALIADEIDGIEFE